MIVINTRSPLRMLTLSESVQMINALLTPQDQFHIKQYNSPSCKKHLPHKQQQVPFLSTPIRLETVFGETEEEYDLLRVSKVE